ncbi:hypothetical protein ACOMHN_042114 [Nucella lapillus]
MPSSSIITDGEVTMLIPYVLFVFLYLLTFHPSLRLPPETVTAAIAKATPIWYLVIYVGLNARLSENSLVLGMWVGLVLSSVGDVCLIWPKSLFLPGVFFFALAQSAYICGLKSWLYEGSYVLETFALYILFYCFLFADIKSWLMKACLLVYFALVFTMANLALQRHLVGGNQGSFWGVVGGVLFVVSDLLIGVNSCRWSFPMAGGVIMLTYYIAQGAIAFGAVSSARA